MRYSLVFIGILWAVFIVDEVFGLGLSRFGLRPGSTAGLVGVITAPLLHANFPHILSNTLPMFIYLNTFHGPYLGRVIEFFFLSAVVKTKQHF